MAPRLGTAGDVSGGPTGAAWFDPEAALWKIHKGQQPILREAVRLIR